MQNFGIFTNQKRLHYNEANQPPKNFRNIFKN